MPGPAMGLAEVDDVLRRRAEERDRVAGDLLDLDDHPGHRLLTGMTPTGETGRRWQAAQARYVTLWWLFDAYRRALDRAQELRSAARPDLAALTALLTGPSVALEPGDVPVEKRSLLQAAGERVTLDVLLARMDAAYREVAGTVADVDAAWAALLPRLDEADAARAAARGLARDLGVQDPDLDELDDRAAALRASVTTDPLGCAGRGDELDALASACAARKAALERAVLAREEFAERARRLEERIARVAEAEREALRVRDLVLVKIAAPALPAMPDQAPALRDRLGALRTLTGRWLELAERLTAMERATDEALARTESVTESIAGLIGRRDELRGRLSAYQAKAVRLGHAEDVTLTELYGAARDVLWSAPCDLRRATVAVAEYQRAITRIGAAG
ncbi:hypothetical protein Skr01_07490 [Sphaerisporangium krabiense]|uniref:Uncharacterized protein n=1 Tax=Sphaerisporangium krabiense TaxID=763782 RepID=A0A7W8ZCX0_9ACTN|nr:hypothetical protein [Sphaerisporangium krabiense]MBB5631699.1 hypothetical protein [Sphaerisporangium krabiense]GII60664.1 hypothetical protein Skr01_07490 [Sphaerisporangium krabiense]